MPSSPNQSAIPPSSALAFTSLPDHLTSDKSFLSSYARSLAAIAMADKTVSVADFAALTEVARSAQYPALMGALILQSLEQGVDLNRALADLSKAAKGNDEQECAAAFTLAKPLIVLQGHQARPLAKRLAAAMGCTISASDLQAMPEEEEIGLLNSLTAKARRLVNRRDVTDSLLDFGRNIGDLEIISSVRAFQHGALSKQALDQQFEAALSRAQYAIAQYRARDTSTPSTPSSSMLNAANELKQQIGQRLAILQARIQYERQAFAEDIDDLVYDAGNAIENALADRLHTDQWKDKDVWSSIANSQFGSEAERRISRAVRRREEILRLLKEELRLLQSDLRIAQASILSKQHRAELAGLMPELRIGTRIVNSIDSAANMTLAAGSLAVAGTGAAAYLLGSAVVLPIVAPAVPFLAGAMAVAGLFKWFNDNDKRKISEIKHKRAAIEEVVRQRLAEASNSFNSQLSQLENDYRQTALAILNPILLEAEAAQQLQLMHQRVAAQILDQSEAMMRELSGQVR